MPCLFMENHVYWKGVVVGVCELWLEQNLPKQEEKSEKAENEEQKGRKTVCNYSDTAVPEKKMTKEAQTSNSLPPN